MQTSRMPKTACTALAIASLALGACGGGGGDGDAEESAASRRSAGSERAAEEPQDGLQIEGLMGTIPQEQVNRTLQPRTEAFARCFAQGGNVDFLEGDIRLSFRIRTDGSVLWVYPSRTSIGHRAVERCIVERARGVQFPRPRGGEAEFTWGFGLDAASDVRPPVAWSAADVASVLSAQGASLRSQCGGQGGFQVTAYVDRGGQVMAAGASAPDDATAEQLDCVASGVAGWRMPDPGSYPAKVTFDL